MSTAIYATASLKNAHREQQRNEVTPKTSSDLDNLDFDDAEDKNDTGDRRAFQLELR